MKCKFCERMFLKSAARSTHQRFCPNNPEKEVCVWTLIRKFGTARTKSNDEIFIQHSTFARHALKRRLLEESLIVHKCAICKIPPVWQNKPMPLILDHINGDRLDNRLENLRFICSNCDTQLPTYKSKNRNYKDRK